MISTSMRSLIESLQWLYKVAIIIAQEETEAQRGERNLPPNRK